MRRGVEVTIRWGGEENNVTEGDCDDDSRNMWNE
jgi:hypothetical protein